MNEDTEFWITVLVGLQYYNSFRFLEYCIRRITNVK